MGKYLQNVDVSGNALTSLRGLGALKHMIKLNASNNQLKFSFDFHPPANLEWVDYSGNQITKIDGVANNKSLRVLSLNGNAIEHLENLDGLWLEELFISANNLTKIQNLDTLPVLRTLDLSKN